MAVISISRQFGAGGYTLGQALAKQLGYKFVSRAIINRMAREANVSRDWVEGVEKEAGGWVNRLTRFLVSSDFVERHIGESRSDFDEERYIDFLKRLLPSMAAEGDIVIIGRGGQCILPDSPDTFKFYLAADFEERVEFIQDTWKMEREDAARAIHARQKRSDNFLKRLGLKRPDDPTLYHLVINTSRVPLEQAEALILDLVRMAGR
ncbi:MAG: cytidylate kinase-like family protein [Deltaproteobacteria bacterium]|nr:cytidylate kinase-like family protein [Deltaproteobacteria bacterium]